MATNSRSNDSTTRTGQQADDVDPKSLPIGGSATYPDDSFGGGVIGNTPGSGPDIEGSSPSPRAMRIHSAHIMAPSSSGLGRRPLKAVAPVQVRSGLPTRIPCAARDSVRFGARIWRAQSGLGPRLGHKLFHRPPLLVCIGAA